MKDAEERTPQDSDSGSDAPTVTQPTKPEVPSPRPSLAAVQLPVVEGDRYEIQREHERGGNSRILVAHDRRLDRLVAIKEVVKPSGPSRARFVREALVTARLQHPSIVPIYDAGQSLDGQPFYAMKLISGRSLRELIDGADSLAGRIALLPHLIAAADAVAYAHDQRIIHRDLKPANILVGPFGETVVIDWGLAKDRSSPEGAVETSPGPYQLAVNDMTVVGAVMGTPQYMAPEQAAGAEVDERADVYALGAVLYHLLAGAPPYTGQTSHEIIDQVRTRRPRPLEQQQPDAPRELLTIVDKAMARRAAARYPTAREFAEDLRRFQTGQLVSAHEYSWGTLARRWLGRHRGVVAVAGLSCLVLVLGAALSLRRIVGERNRAEAHARKLVRVEARQGLERDPTAALAWLKSHPLAGEELTEVRDLALDAWSRGVARHVLRREERRGVAGAFSADGRRFVGPSEGRQLRLWDLGTGATLRRHPYRGDIQAIALSPDGRLVAFAISSEERVFLWDVEADAVRELAAPEPLAALRFTAEGRRLLGASNDKRLRLWELGGPGHTDFGCQDGAARSAALSPDGRYLACVDPGGAITVWETATRRPRTLGPAPADLQVLVFSPDGEALAAGSKSGAIDYWHWHWELEGGSHQRWPGHAQAVSALAFSPDGVQLVSAGLDETVRRWEPGAGRGEVLGQHRGPSLAVAFSPDGRHVASGGADASVQLWNLSTGKRRVLRGHRADITALGFSPGGDLLASASRDKSTRIWSLGEGAGAAARAAGLEWPSEADDAGAAGGAEEVLRAHERGIGELAVSPAGGWAASAGDDGLVGLWQLADARLTRLAGHDDAVTALAPSPDGHHLASAGQDRTVRLWDSDTGRERWRGRHDTTIWDLAFSLDGRRLASAGQDGQVKLWGAGDGSLHALLSHRGGVRAVAFSPDGRLLATGDTEAMVRVWQLGAEVTTRRVLRGPAGIITQVAFAPSGRELGAAAWDGSVWLWQTASGEGRALGRHPEGWTALALAPDGRWLASVGADGLVQLWDLGHHTLRTLAGHGDALNAVAFSPDGLLLATGGWDGTVRLWDVSLGVCRAILRHEATVRDVVFSPLSDGRLLLSAGEDRTVRLWRLERLPEVPHTPAALRAWMASTTSTVVRGDGQVATP